MPARYLRSTASQSARPPAMLLLLLPVNFQQAKFPPDAILRAPDFGRLQARAPLQVFRQPPSTISRRSPKPVIATTASREWITKSPVNITSTFVGTGGKAA